MFLYSAFVPPPPTLLLFFCISPPPLYGLFFHTETAFVPAHTLAWTHTQVHTYPAVLRSNQRDNKLIESHYYRSPPLQSRTSLSYPLCPEEKNLILPRKFDGLGNWGHLNRQECSNYLNLGGVLRENGTCWKFQLSHATLLICTAFISGRGLAPSSYSWSIWWLEKELCNRNSMCIHLNSLQGTCTLYKGTSITFECKWLYCGFIWTLCPLVFQLFRFTRLHSISEVCEHIHSCFCVFETDRVTNRLVSEVFFIPSCETPLYTRRSFPNSPPHTVFYHFHLSCLIPFSSIIPLIPYSICVLSPTWLQLSLGFFVFCLHSLSVFAILFSSSFLCVTNTYFQKSCLHASPLAAMRRGQPLVYVWVTGFEIPFSLSSTPLTCCLFFTPPLCMTLLALLYLFEICRLAFVFHSPLPLAVNA